LPMLTTSQVMARDDVHASLLITSAAAILNEKSAVDRCIAIAEFEQLNDRTNFEIGLRVE
jgi:hypothetical protein